MLRLNYKSIILFLLLLVIFKVIAMAVTTGSGGIGGIFAPALFVGGISGVTLAKVVNIFSPGGISENNFALVGMAGVMAGVMHAPLTAIFLIAEITGGYALLIPLIITATISYDIRDTIFNTELYDKIEIPELMHSPPAIISKDENMEKVLEISEETESWNLPVTDNNKYTGFISRSKIFSSYGKLLREFSDD
ncbi:MAG: chloride channel protein [Bacteroidales bacterium]|nr:chloride channel protein [Bacteroidales bacterium]